MGQIDENQEVIAQIQLAINAYDKSQLPDNILHDNEIPAQEEDDCAQRDSCSWYLGAPGQLTTAKKLENDFVQTGISLSLHHNFDANLKEFLIKNTADSVAANSTIKVSSNRLSTSGHSLAFNTGPGIQVYLFKVSISGGFYTSSRYTVLQFTFPWTGMAWLCTHQHGLWTERLYMHPSSLTPAVHPPIWRWTWCCNCAAVPAQHLEAKHSNWELRSPG